MSNPEDLNKIWDTAIITADVDGLVDIITDGHVREGPNYCLRGKKEFREYWTTIFKKGGYLSSQSEVLFITYVKPDPGSEYDNIAVITGDWKGVVDEKGQKKVITGHWQDVRKLRNGEWKISYANVSL